MTTPTYSSADALRGRGLSVKVDCPTRCQMCEAHEVRTHQLRQEIASADYFANDLKYSQVEENQRRVAAEDLALRYRDKFRLAVAALLGVLGMILAGWVK